MARFARLYPLYVVIFLIHLLYFGLQPDWSRPVTWASVTLTQSWFNAHQIFFPPAWSISTEVFFYLVFAALVWPIAKITKPVTALVVIIAFAIAFLAFVFLSRETIMNVVLRPVSPAIIHPGGSADPWLWLSYYAPYLRVFEFLVGVMASKIVQQGVRAPAWLGYSCIGWCVGVMVAGGWFRGTLLESYLPNFIYAPALAGAMIFATQKNAFAAALSFAPVVVLGEISYSVYMFQAVVFKQVEARFDSPLEIVAATAVCTALLATVTYYLVEMPGRIGLRSLLTWRLPAFLRRKPPETAPAE